MNHQHHDGPHPEYTCHLANPSTDRVPTRHIVVRIGTGLSSMNVVSYALELVSRENQCRFRV